MMTLTSNNIGIDPNWITITTASGNTIQQNLYPNGIYPTGQAGYPTGQGYVLYPYGQETIEYTEEGYKVKYPDGSSWEFKKDPGPVYSPVLPYQPVPEPKSE
jgi:hypothetical protein